MLLTKLLLKFVPVDNVHGPESGIIAKYPLHVCPTKCFLQIPVMTVIVPHWNWMYPFLGMKMREQVRG
jgi:hypothetical protein